MRYYLLEQEENTNKKDEYHMLNITLKGNKKYAEYKAFLYQNKINTINRNIGRDIVKVIAVSQRKLNKYFIRSSKCQ